MHSLVSVMNYGGLVKLLNQASQACPLPLTVPPVCDGGGGQALGRPSQPIFSSSPEASNYSRR